jgi:hypothetical protein
MPFDGTGFPRELTETEARDLAVLRKARHRIRYRWMWMQIDGREGLACACRLVFGHRCAIMAIGSAAWWMPSVAAPVHLRLARQLPAPFDVADYNDAPTTTHADILGLFDRAIAELEHVE